LCTLGCACDYHGKAEPFGSTPTKESTKHIVVRLQRWVEFVEHDGLMEARKIPGFHDEPLRGKRAGQRSIRLSRAYRAIYRVVDDVIEFALVKEVHKHDY
jgi:proteic killer suppression protein